MFAELQTVKILYDENLYQLISASFNYTLKNKNTDEEYDELFIDKGACVEFRFCAGVWYIISSDGLKMS